MLRWLPNNTNNPRGGVVSEGDEAPAVPAVLGGKYLVRRVIGRGGVGVVVEATRAADEARVAVKMLPPRALQSHSLARMRFEREVLAAERARGRHLVHVHEVDVFDGAPSMVMEHLEGKLLSTVLLERGPLPIGEALGYAFQLCEALAEVHAGGVVHRDLRPANVFLAVQPDGSVLVKLLDFGMSKVDAADQEKRGSSLVIGTPGSMSPEQLRSPHDVDGRADIWSLGAILYQMLTGRTPFLVESIVHFYATMLSDTPEPPSRLRLGIPARLDAIVLRCLAKSPSARYENVAKLARALAGLAPSLDAAACEVERLVARGLEKSGPNGALCAPCVEPIPNDGGALERTPGFLSRRRRALWLALLMIFVTVCAVVVLRFPAYAHELLARIAH
jgi:eukaryotic-like serine/threonine-protein kinase